MRCNERGEGRENERLLGVHLDLCAMRQYMLILAEISAALTGRWSLIKSPKTNCGIETLRYFTHGENKPGGSAEPPHAPHTRPWCTGGFPLTLLFHSQGRTEAMAARLHRTLDMRGHAECWSRVDHLLGVIWRAAVFSSELIFPVHLSFRITET